MKRAIELARRTALEDNAGGPFGCVIVKDSKVVAEGANRVIADKDPTCHAEINAIRAACAVLGTHELRGCVLYTTCEPCPMCYAACCWARVDKIFFASNIHDAKKYGGFDDAAIYNEVKRPIQDRSPEGTELLRKEMLDLWQEFRNMTDPPSY